MSVIELEGRNGGCIVVLDGVAFRIAAIVGAAAEQAATKSPHTDVPPSSDTFSADE